MNAFSTLAWLPAAPADFREQCRQARADGAGGDVIRRLANFALDGNQLTSLARTIQAISAGGGSLAPLTPFRLAVIGNGTLDLLIPPLVASAARYGLALECIAGHYDQALQDAASPASEINRFKPDAVLLALDHRGLPLRAAMGDPADAQAAVDFIEAVRDGIRRNSGAVCIVQTLAAPPETLFGSLDRSLPGATRQVIDAVNRELGLRVGASDDLLLDVAGLAETVGLANWFDPILWNMAKLPFANGFAPLYTDHVARLIGALRGKSRRCLILDLDNTVWGGVIGDDGMEGIKVAQGDAVGEAFLSVQRWALSLRERGVVLAVSSKNTDSVARQVFREHPEMLLRENHLAVFQANWNDKATNIKAIAEELSLGLDAMVFLDDNPVERGLVRQILPQVAVPELPEDPALYVRTLAAAGYFEAIAFSDEDRQRAQFYSDNARRTELKQQAGDVNAYLASLQMEITFQPFDAIGRSRIAQLISKSNQFNLTTRRYSEAEVAEAERDPGAFTLQVRLLDAFGDNGMICVIICREAGPKVWEIDTWLMSCRVLGRGVERMVLREILDHARAAGIERIVGLYRPTERNALVENHYRELGFDAVETRAGGETVWELAVDASVEAAPMSVRRLGFEGQNDAA